MSVQFVLVDDVFHDDVLLTMVLFFHSTITILVVDVGFTIIETFADAWMTSNGPHGFLLEVGGSFPPNGPLSVDLDQAKCYGATIESAAGANPSFPRRYQIDTNARWTKELCGPNTYSVSPLVVKRPHIQTALSSILPHMN